MVTILVCLICRVDVMVGVSVSLVPTWQHEVGYRVTRHMADMHV